MNDKANIAAIASNAMAEASISTRDSRYRIWIVEADGACAETLKVFVETDDHLAVVGVSRDAVAALDSILRAQPDLVLMETRMPGMSGIDCVLHIRGANPGIKILMLSGLEDGMVVLDCLGAGASGFISKPFSRSEIVHGIRFALVGGASISETVLAGLIHSVRRRATAAGVFLPARRREEQQVLQLMMKGLQNKEIAASLHMTVSQVTMCLHRAYVVMGVGNRVEAANKLRGEPF